MTPAIPCLAPGSNPVFSSRGLLGKSCRAHVESALAAAFPQGVHSLLLWVREDAPCLSPQTLALLEEQACNGLLAAVFAADGCTPLAAAFPKQAQAFFASESGESLDVDRILRRADCPFPITHCQPADPGEAFAVTDAASYAAAFRLLKARITQQHMENGVIVLEPERTVIEAEVSIQPGTVIYAGNTLQGSTSIGADCTLYPNNRLQNAVVGHDTTVENSVLLDCSVGSHTTVGPFAYLRPQSVIGDNCRIGDFVEIKNSAIGDGTKVSHLTYVGDSDLGKDINLGCGVVFVNYDGKTKTRSTVEDHAFIGCNCNLVSPVRIGKNAYLAAGSTVVEDVPEDSLYVARSRGVLKENWVVRRKEQGKL